MTIICVPYAGATSSVYWPWKAENKYPINVILYELPGRGVRFGEAYALNMREIVFEIIDIILGLPKNEKYALYGHSMGGSIIFQVAQTVKLKKLKEPVHLFMSGRSAPHYIHESKGIFDHDDDKFIAELKKYEGEIDHILANKEMKNIYLSILRSDFRLIETFEYDPNVVLDCDITVLYGQFDDTLQGHPHEWIPHTLGHCSFISFEGNHFFLLNHLTQIMDDIHLKLLNYISE